jgi:outer membrane protein OmpA-like peptidoglycan-associated protein
VQLPNGAIGAFHGKKDGIQTGWAVGAGTEYAFAPQFGLVLEYLHTDLGSFSYNAPIAGVVGQRVTVDNNANIFRIGVNYHFPPPPPPPAPVAAPAPPPAPPKVFIVFFDWDKDVVTPEGHAIIRQAADAYRAGAPVQLQVTGYTDRSGSPGYNQRLSERRANNVAKALAAAGVPREQMIVSGRGENDNRVPTADGVREPQNRRVEIIAP